MLQYLNNLASIWEVYFDRLIYTVLSIWFLPFAYIGAAPNTPEE